jgi:hypothetical protein
VECRNIVRYLENRDWNEVDMINNQILTAYSLDFAKHIDSKDIPRLHLLWDNIQDNLAKEDRRFRYSLIEKGGRARAYENSVEWLALSGLIHRVFEIQTLRLPLSSCKNRNAFKHLSKCFRGFCVQNFILPDNHYAGRSVVFLS